MGKYGPPRHQTNYKISKGIDESYQKVYILLNYNHYVKSYGYFCQILAFFTMPAHKIWSCHVTQEANFEKFLSCPDSTFNIRKVTRFLAEKLSTSEIINQKPHGGGDGNPPSDFRVKVLMLSVDYQKS